MKGLVKWYLSGISPKESIVIKQSSLWIYQSFLTCTPPWVNASVSFGTTMPIGDQDLAKICWAPQSESGSWKRQQFV